MVQKSLNNQFVEQNHLHINDKMIFLFILFLMVNKVLCKFTDIKFPYFILRMRELDILGKQFQNVKTLFKFTLKKIPVIKMHQ